MKKNAMWMAGILFLVAVLALRAAENQITNYLANYKMVSATSTNAGDTGLSTGTTYYCFAAADVAQLTEAQGTHTNGSFPQLMFAIQEAFWTGWSGVASSNRSTVAIPGRSTTTGPTGNVMVVHTLRTAVSVTGKLDVVTE